MMISNNVIERVSDGEPDTADSAVLGIDETLASYTPGTGYCSNIYVVTKPTH